jgi:hypothetical protein
MSVRFIVAAVAGAVVGYFTESPQAGMATFSAIYGVTGFLDPNQKVTGPRLQDLKFPAASYGSPEPYVEGHPRVPGVVVWSIDPKREVANQVTQSSKGGPSVDSTTFTYEVDMRIVISENPGYRWRKCFSNGALIASRADDADAETLASSAETVSWREIRDYTGEDDQMPDPTEEAYVGTGLSPGYVGRSSIVIIGLNCGQSGQLPILTWEITNGNAATVAAKTRLQTYFDNDSTEDISAYAIGPGTLTTTGGGIAPDSGAFHTELDQTCRLVYENAVLGGDNISPVMFEGFVTFNSSENFADMPFIEYVPNTALYSTTFIRLQFYGTLGRVDLGTPASTVTLGTCAGRTHFEVSYGSDGTFRVFFGGVLAFSGSSGVPNTGSIGRLTLGNPVGINNAAFTIDEFAVRFRDGHTASFTPPEHIDPPDGTIATYQLAEPTHEEALQRQWQRAGLDLALLDASAVSDIFVRAMAVTQLTSPRAVMENLAAAGMYEFVETGDGVKVVKRGGAMVRTIAYEDLGAFTGGEAGEPLPRVRGNELEVAEQVSIKYMNVNDDYRDGTETSTRLATGSSIVTVAEVPLGLTGTEAKRLADFAVTDALASIMRVGPVTLTRKHADLESTDVVGLTAKDGSVKRTRIKKRTESPGGLITIEGVEDDASAVNSAAVTSSNYTSTSTVRAFSPVDATFIDGPILHESDNSRGAYVAAKPTGTKFSSYAVLKSPDDVDFSVLGVGYKAAVMGTCSVVPGSWPTRTFNERDSIVCDLGAGTAAGTTRAAILADKSVNSFFIGADGRWMFGQFRDAELISAGVFKLTGLLLGDRGTEHNIGTQVAGDEIILLASGGINRISEDATDLGVLRHYKAVSNGRSVAGTASQPFTEFEVGLKPFAPVYLRADRAGGDITLRWTRRTRLATITAGPMAPIVPLGEETESYSIDIFSDGTYTTVVRTLTGSTPTITYLSADQVADFGSTQATIYAKVYQLSGLVGRGFPLQAAA